MSEMIPRNTSIPIKKEKEYTTSKDYQTDVKIQIFEGERKMTADNHKLGEFTLKGLKPEKKGLTKIIVHFEIDSNGIFNLTAEEKKNKKN